MRLREAVLDRIRALPLFQAARRLALRTRIRLARLRQRLRRLFA